jgi:RNA polymerase sigma-70 factor (ECF subfamily)
MTHFLANEWDKSQRQKRGGAHRVLSFDDAEANARYCLEPVEHTTPETLFERRWAETVVGVVLDRLAAETDEKRFAVLKEFLVEDDGMLSYEGAAARLGMTVAAVTSAIHRMRARFGAVLIDELAHTVSTPEDVEPELRHLLAMLGD